MAYLRPIAAFLAVVFTGYLTRDVLAEGLEPPTAKQGGLQQCADGRGSLVLGEQLAILQRLWLRPILFIKCGGPEFVDDGGVVWQTDAGLSKAATYGDISGYGRTLLPPLYSSGRSSRHGPIEYHLPLPLGFYTVSFYFMERYQRQVGGSVFDVEAEGVTIVKDLDVVEQVGVGNPLKISRDIGLYDGILDIIVRPTRGIASVSGISIAPTSP